MRKFYTFALLVGAAILALAYSVLAQQTSMGVCNGAVDVVAQSTGLAVNCTPNAPPPPVPTASLTANPTAINPGQSSTLAWNSTNATACAASGAWTGTEPLSGTQSVSPATSATYTLNCSGAGGSASASANVAVNPVVTPPSGNCGLTLGGPAIFCEPFDVVNAGIPSRTGDLDPNVWGVSRFTGANFNQGWFNGWNATIPIQLCDGSVPNVTVPRDVQICNGQLRTAADDNPSGVFDNGTVLIQAMYPKQPFDFAGRTGVVAFDVSNDTVGTHGAWPEFWVTDLPIPAPFGTHFFNSLPANGFGIRMGASAPPGTGGFCQDKININTQRWMVDSAVFIRNYVWEDVNFQGYPVGTVSNPPVTMTLTDCVLAPDLGAGPGAGTAALNHVEFKINTNTIEVWATDAGVAPTPATLRKIAVFNNVNLSFTRGLIWMENAHYNADKGGDPSQRAHTFVWDNVAFDGPFTYRDFSFDALDALVPNPPTNTIDLGRFSNANQGSTWNVDRMPANPQGTAARVMFNFYNQFAPNPTALAITVNGHAHSLAWPYPDQTQNTWRTLAITIPISDLVAGTNVVTIGSDQPQVTSNVNIVLVDVPGGVPVLPGNSRSYPQ